MKSQRLDTISYKFPTVTSDGFIKANPVVTRTGVFRYMNTDGTIRRELRHPDDVMKAESLDTLKGVVTLDHPSELVNADNAHLYQKGFTGDHVTVDGGLIKVNVTITNKDAVDSIIAGKNQLSLGYTLELDEEIGEYNGELYEYRQRDINYNHLSVVDIARAGAVANIKMDSGSEIMVSMDSVSQDNNSNPKKELLKMAKINIDGAVVEVDDKVALHLDSVKAERDTATARATNLDKELNTVKGEKDALQGENEKLKKANSDDAIALKVSEMFQLHADARKIVGKDASLDGLTGSAIVDMVNKKFNGDAAVEGSEEYKKAYFAIAVKSVAQDSEDIASQRTLIADKKEDTAVDLRNFDSVDSERNAMMNSFAKNN